MTKKCICQICSCGWVAFLFIRSRSVCDTLKFAERGISLSSNQSAYEFDLYVVVVLIMAKQILLFGRRLIYMTQISVAVCAMRFVLSAVDARDEVWFDLPPDRKRLWREMCATSSIKQSYKRATFNFLRILWNCMCEGRGCVDRNLTPGVQVALFSLAHLPRSRHAFI